ncbi:hypothetical protein MHU86_17924 [Fragilaria crotonensis]|nr:hypothetical protein MHU86_17924 [Fragilaria crotonensis]
MTLRRHCAPLTQDHIERTRESFYSIKQGHQEVATSFLNRIRTLSRDCYHAGITNTDADIIKRVIHGGSNHPPTLLPTNALMPTSVEQNYMTKNYQLLRNLRATY